ncbi:hypothetical protein K438DRAFT_1958980 [Mycena galopus ATCC 62051]|nr:hypothetical protein K438DRAFT_1958980 [Mycena galopus ATCC 62051]
MREREKVLVVEEINLATSGCSGPPASSPRPDVLPLASHFPDSLPPRYPTPLDVPPALPDVPSLGPLNFRLPDLDLHLGVWTRFPGSSDKPQTSCSSSQQSPLSLLLPPPPSPNLAAVTTSDPLPSSSAPDIQPGPPEPVHIWSLRCGLLCIGSSQILWPSYSTSALTPLTLPYPILRVPSPALRISDMSSILWTPDLSSGTSGTSR